MKQARADQCQPRHVLRMGLRAGACGMHAYSKRRAHRTQHHISHHKQQRILQAATHITSMEHITRRNAYHKQQRTWRAREGCHAIASSAAPATIGSDRNQPEGVSCSEGSIVRCIRLNIICTSFVSATQFTAATLLFLASSCTGQFDRNPNTSYGSAAPIHAHGGPSSEQCSKYTCSGRCMARG